MNLTKRITAWFLTLVMVLSLIPQTVFAQETVASSLQYEVTQEMNVDKTETTISLKFTDAETNQLEKVTLPDGVEKGEDLSTVTYAVSENGTYDFKVNYLMNETPQEEIIPVEVSGLGEKEAEETLTEENIVSLKNDSDILQAKENTYNVSNAEEMQSALEQIKNGYDTEATIILTADIGNNVRFEGVPDKSIVVKSTEGKKYALTLAYELVGDITLDNVKASAGTLYCNGHRTIFTKNCDFTIAGTLYGGGNQKTVQSVYVKINGTGNINTSDLENVVVGGSYKGSVEGDIYVELAGNISYGTKQGGNYLIGTNKATAYGGDNPGTDKAYVGGNVTLILDSPVKDTRPQNVVGAYNSHVKGNVTVQVKSGYTLGIEGMREDPKQSIVDGDIHLSVGDPAYAGTDRICRIGSNWDIIGAGEKINLTDNLFQVGGNVTVDTYENLWGWNKEETPQNDPPGIVGAGSALVGGNVTINANGSHLENIIGVDDCGTDGSIVKGDIVINATDIDLRNRSNAQNGIIPVFETAGKNVTVNLDGGSLSGIYGYGGTVVGNMTINITGKPVFTSDIDGVWGVNNKDTKEKSVLNFDGAETTIPIVGYLTEMNVTNDSDVILGNEKKNAFSIYDVNINSNAKLTTNKQAYSKGSLTMDHGTWISNGNLYITGKTNTNNSKVVLNNYSVFGYGYKNNDVFNDTVVTSNDDTYIFNECNYVDQVYGNAEITNSTWSVFTPIAISGNYNANTSKLNLLAFTGNDNYPDKMIPLEILGEATGDTAVTLVDKTDTSKEGTPVVGQNYINALKTSEKTFELANENAKAEGLYFKKLADADTEGKADYDMWQVAKKDAYTVLYSFEAGTSGKSLPQEVIELLPEDSAKYYEGDIITAKNPIKPEVKVSDGVWTFEGYDADSKIANADNATKEGNIQFTGMWVFKKNAGIINNAPIINAGDKTLTAGDEFDPLKDVTATDKEDGDITLTIDNVIKNEVDTEKAGVYEVTYKVTDSQGASSIKTIKVTVKAKDTSVVPGEPDKPIKPDDTNKPITPDDVNKPIVPDDVNKPIAPDTSVDDNNPLTEDSTNMTLWTLLLITSGIGIIGIYRKKRKINQ